MSDPRVRAWDNDIVHTEEKDAICWLLSGLTALLTVRLILAILERVFWIVALNIAFWVKDIVFAVLFMGEGLFTLHSTLGSPDQLHFPTCSFRLSRTFIMFWVFSKVKQQLQEEK
ncbi:hypothetical protein RhiLY_09654 [Ceratobasidium sp. AG-Ba]|nr:hypothetical protein RhiLY_09654 [Ceratobasidium sp. AG-Ba]